MNRLILFRHAKAAPGNFGEHDRQRALTSRGQDDARAMGNAIRERGLAPHMILVSDAQRCVQTWQAVAPYFPDSQWHCAPELYLASADELFFAADGTGKDSVMLIAHNPGLQDLAVSRCPTGDTRASRLIRKFPTSAVAILERAEQAEWSLRDVLTKADI